MASGENSTATQFKPGESGNPNGRPAGAKTKFRLKTAMEIFEETGFNPINELVKIANETVKEELKLRAIAELTKYFTPQLKSVESKIVVSNQENALKALDDKSPPVESESNG